MNTKKLPTKITCAIIVLSGLFIYLSCNTGSSSYNHTTWSQYGGGPDQSKYFDAADITKQNVNQMQVAWTFSTEDNIPYMFQPIVVDTTMYVYGKNSSLIALSIITGKEIWIHTNLQGLSRRGMNYWESKNGKDKRLVFTLNNSLQEIDAITGKTITSFGDSGYVDMRVGLDRDPTSIRRMQAMTPGVIYDDLIIMGSAPGEGYFSAPGYIRAYNIVTGKLEWTFHTIPHPGEFGYETWPKDAYKYAGGVNVWSEMSVDEKRGIVFLPLGSPTYDYYGADRIGSNLYGNSLVALDARTGKHKWHFQTVHHDIWDYDLSAAPQLLTINKDGKKIDAVAVATKHGFVFVFNRDNGEPVFPIEEKPFPASEMPGEKAWVTQPIPSLPSFTRHEVTKETLNPFFPDSTKQKWFKRLDAAKSGLYVPPSDKYETIMMPGALGGANYGNTAADPKNGILYILTQEYASVYKLSKVEPPKIDLSENDLKKVKTFYTANCQSCHGDNLQGLSGPSLANIGQRIFYDEFKNIVQNGRGRMPAIPHVDEQTMSALFRYMGGIPRSFPGRRSDNKKATGPIVDSGGAQIKSDVSKATPMSDYPEGVSHPENRYTTDYGIEWMGLAAPPWSSILAYDLNNGTIKWRMPVGEDSAYVKGDKSKGAPAGVLRKGMVITSTGVVFATAKGGKLYAFDAANGNILWETTLSNEVQGQPTMYTYKGKQFLVVNASANFTPDSYNHSVKPDALKKGYIVYALPDQK
ncbi:quinoprotein glucose dehydrogenase [Chitinophagaceae bacterium IBVUCB2]|nr:quinoprotein glucose dehydrogenase [Chitinophagaceae bacterium IBVUCB2]